MQIECNQPNINSLLPEEDLLKCFSYFNLTDMPSIEKVCILSGSALLLTSASGNQSHFKEKFT